MESGPYTGNTARDSQAAAPAKTIALVANQSWSIYNFRLPLIRAFRQQGYRVVVIAPVDESVHRLLEEPGIEVHSLRHFHRNSTSPFRNFRLLLELFRVYRRLRPAVVLHFGIQANIFGNLAARLAHTPSVCVVTGLGYSFLHQGWMQRLASLLYKISFTSARKVVFENQDDLELMVARGLARRDQCVRVPGCGVDTAYFSPNGALPDPGKIVFTFIGRLLYDKGLHEFAEAADRLRKSVHHAECWILGHLDDENPAHIDRNDLIRWVRSGAVHYKGATTDVRPYIGQSDWIVLPSYREGLSRTLLEAMSMAKPIITTDTPGCRETVEHSRNGLLVPVADADALYKAMMRACGMSAVEVAALGAYGREKVEREYGEAMVGKVYLEIILALPG